MPLYTDNYTVAVERDTDNVVVSVRLKGADAARYWRVMDEAKSRNPYIDKSHVIRELLGLDSPSVLTAEEISYFRTGRKESGTLVNSKLPVLNIKLKEGKDVKKQAK